MSESLDGLHRKIGSASELKQVVRTMKAIAASNITRFEQAVRSLDVYETAVKAGLHVSLHRQQMQSRLAQPATATGVILFGTDQGLVGQFNDELANFALRELADASSPVFWVVGERLAYRIRDAGMTIGRLWPVPSSTAAITGLVGNLLADVSAWLKQYPDQPLWVIHHQPAGGELYHPVAQRILPFDAGWRRDLLAMPWPDACVPEVMGDTIKTLGALIREYLFVSCYRACAHSLASENASRLAAMQRADRNIDEMLHVFRTQWNQLRQESIDEELFDVVAGFEALNTRRPQKPAPNHHGGIDNSSKALGSSVTASPAD